LPHSKLPFQISGRIAKTYAPTLKTKVSGLCHGIGLYTPEGEYRFTKGEISLKTGWKIEENTPLEDSGGSRFNGIIGNAEKSNVFPMVCQEACNFFVAQARKKSKEEFEG